VLVHIKCGLAVRQRKSICRPNPPPFKDRPRIIFEAKQDQRSPSVLRLKLCSLVSFIWNQQIMGIGIGVSNFLESSKKDVLAVQSNTYFRLPRYIQSHHVSRSFSDCYPSIHTYLHKLRVPALDAGNSLFLRGYYFPQSIPSVFQDIKGTHPSVC
jgi:hypothetical protein